MRKQKAKRKNNKSKARELAIDWDAFTKDDIPSVPPPSTNPKTFMGAQKVPNLSVIPPASIIYQGIAMRYGAYLAPRADGKRGYGPYNWRDQPVEVEIYVDAAMRHLMQFQDGDEYELIKDENGEIIGRVPHLAFVLGTIGVLVDALENSTAIDNRPRKRQKVATYLLEQYKQPEKK